MLDAVGNRANHTLSENIGTVINTHDEKREKKRKNEETIYVFTSLLKVGLSFSKKNDKKMK
jgi:hypothetical protein